MFSLLSPYSALAGACTAILSHIGEGGNCKKGGNAVEERNITSLRKELRFEKSEDAFSIEITIGQRGRQHREEVREDGPFWPV